MGQYYVAVNVDDMEHVEPHQYNNGAKLMEHSYIGNNFVEAVEFLLIDTGEDKSRWSGKRIVWAGDYADAEPNEGENLYSLVGDKGLQMLIEAIPSDYKYLVNIDKKEYVDKTECPNYYNESEFCINPLPLLTADGNGRGGGDYHNEHEYVGVWAKNRISLMKEVPEGYVKIKPDFK